MKRGRVYTDYLHDILMYAEKAENFVADADLETFQSNEEKVFAEIRKAISRDRISRNRTLPFDPAR